MMIGYAWCGELCRELIGLFAKIKVLQPLYIYVFLFINRVICGVGRWTVGWIVRRRCQLLLTQFLREEPLHIFNFRPKGSDGPKNNSTVESEKDIDRDVSNRSVQMALILHTRSLQVIHSTSTKKIYTNTTNTHNELSQQYKMFFVFYYLF